MKRLFLILASIIPVFMIIAVSKSMAQRPEPKKTEIKGHTMYTMLEPGDIPAIFDPEFISVAEADKLYHPNEPLLVVVGGGTARAYSTWHLDRHEIVNDEIDGSAIAATW